MRICFHGNIRLINFMWFFFRQSLVITIVSKNVSDYIFLYSVFVDAVGSEQIVNYRTEKNKHDQLQVCVFLEMFNVLENYSSIDISLYTCTHVGILASVWPCGIISLISELYNYFWKQITSVW